MRIPAARILSFTLLVAVLGLFAPLTAVHSAPPPGFADDFNTPVLDPAWQVYTGSRLNEYYGPANHYSLTDSPGRLRYYVDPMTHYDGFLNNYQRTYGYHSSYDHDPGLEISREFSGDHWVFETKAEFYLPYTNGRLFTPRVYLGDGGENTYAIGFSVIRDVHWRGLYAYLAHKPAADFASLTYLEQTPIEVSQSEPDAITYYFQVERAGGQLSTRWSLDGQTWTTMFTRDLGTALTGLDQRVTLAGLSWFNSAGSYADYDYVRVTPANTTPDCSGAAPSASILWPPDHQFVPIEVQGVTDADGDSISIAVDAIRQDEPVNGRGDGDSAPDGKGVGSATAEVRAERAAGTKRVPANGRVYHIAFSAIDGRGAVCTGEVTVGVPFSMGKRPLFTDDGPLFDSTGSGTAPAAPGESSTLVGEYKLFLPSIKDPQPEVHAD